MALGDVEGVAGEVFVHGEPWFAVAFFVATDADAFALSERVKRQADVFADEAAIEGFNRAFVRR